MTVKIINQGLLKYILSTWLLCGTLDALSAMIINPKVPPALIFQYISSGLFGKAAFSGGTAMVIYGVLIHYLIALVFTIALFKLYPVVINILRNKIVLAFVFGLLVFAIMNFIALPYLSHIVAKPMNWESALKNMAALIISFGFPIAFIAGRYYRD